jgi:HD-like signal output (HDOD) protein
MRTEADIVERLFFAMRGAKGFPTIEHSVTSVISKLSDDKYGTRDVVGHIIEDFSLTQRVLKLANSAMYAPFSSGVAKVSAALDVLGSDALMHLVLSATLATEEEVERDESLARTLLSSELARNLCDSRSEEVSIAALMYNLGSLMTQRFLPAEHQRIAQKVTIGATVSVAAMDVLGLTFEQLGAAVARRWKLPETIVSIIDGTGDTDLVAIARFSNTAATLIHAGEFEKVDQLVNALELDGIDKSGIKNLISAKAERIKSRSIQTPKVARDTALEKLFAELEAEDKRTVQALAGSVFSNVADILQTAHGLLFMRTKSGDFVARFGYGKGIDELRSRLRIAMEHQPTAFHAAIKNNVDLSIADVPRMKVSALPDGYREMLPNVKQFLILPIANSTVSGLLYWDWDTETQLSPTELAAIKQLRKLFLHFFPP